MSFAASARALAPAATPEGAFAGYASLFEIPDLSNDIISRGAFTRTLADRGPGNIKLLFQHEASKPIGVWTTLREDNRGLYVEGQLTLDNSLGRDVHALLRSGAIDGLSIGFRSANSNRPTKRSGRRLDLIDLWEISIVTFPMLPSARIAAVKTQPRARSPTAHLPLPQRLALLTAAIRAAT